MCIDDNTPEVFMENMVICMCVHWCVCMYMLRDVLNVFIQCITCRANTCVVIWTCIWKEASLCQHILACQ